MLFALLRFWTAMVLVCGGVASHAQTVQLDDMDYAALGHWFAEQSSIGDARLSCLNDRPDVLFQAHMRRRGGCTRIATKGGACAAVAHRSLHKFAGLEFRTQLDQMAEMYLQIWGADAMPPAQMVADLAATVVKRQGFEVVDVNRNGETVFEIGLNRAFDPGALWETYATLGAYRAPIEGLSAAPRVSQAVALDAASQCLEPKVVLNPKGTGRSGETLTLGTCFTAGRALAAAVAQTDRQNPFARRRHDARACHLLGLDVTEPITVLADRLQLRAVAPADAKGVSGQMGHW